MIYVKKKLMGTFLVLRTLSHIIVPLVVIALLSVRNVKILRHSERECSLIFRT